jgi:hypothetical protein
MKHSQITHVYIVEIGHDQVDVELPSLSDGFAAE